MTIYLDNAATSYPKPKQVEEAVVLGFKESAGSLHRSHASDVYHLERRVYEVRTKVARFFGFDRSDHVIFTKNVTEGLNLILKGFLSQGDHVICTSLEHNAVIRPLEYLKNKGLITYTCLPYHSETVIDYNALEEALKQAPKLMVATSASNVTGDIINLKHIGDLCRKYSVPFMIDAAQAAGVLPLDFYDLNATFLAFTGHKSMLGPQGIGGVLIAPQFAKYIEPLLHGGTGSLSEHLEQPYVMPDRFESGTMNVPAILGLGASIDYLEGVGLEAILRHEHALMLQLQDGIGQLKKVKVIGFKATQKRLGVLSLDFEGMDNALIAHDLQERHHIAVRVGLHCAPLAHKAYGTYPQGTVRLSVSHFTTAEDVEAAIRAIKDVVSSY